jgi:16S rRNA (guanine966-N2)-methyltransferase
MAREGLFASLAGRVVDATCLDLFAGTGAVGIEALSRGASSCTFVERSRDAVTVIRRNLETTHFTDRARVSGLPVAAFLDRDRPPPEGYGLIFVDPPYDTPGEGLGELLDRLGGGWLAPEEGLVIMTRGHKSSEVPVPVHFAAWRRLRYGDSHLTLYQEVRWA